jgi:CRP-like cAMP-binding protein
VPKFLFASEGLAENWVKAINDLIGSLSNSPKMAVRRKSSSDQSTALIDGLQEGDLELMLRNSKVIQFGREATTINEGDDVQGIYYIEKGSFR